MLNPHLVSSRWMHVVGLDVTYGCGVKPFLVRSPPGGEGKLHTTKPMRKAMGNHFALFFPRHDMDCAIISKIMA